MKIFNVMFTTRTGGLEQVFLDYTEALSLHSHKVISVIHSKSVISSRINGACHKVPSFSKYDPIALFKLWHIIKNDKPDLIISHGNRAHYMMKKIAGSIPVIGVAHGNSFDHILSCNYIITVNKKLKDEILSRGFEDSAKIEHISNAIRIPTNCVYKPLKYHEIPVLGMIARLEKAKGAEVFIKAIELLRNKNIKYRAQIAGNGPEYENIKKLIQSANLQDIVQMLGWVNDTQIFYDNIDILCIPSYHESFGLIILEAMLSSKPVLVSAISGPLEIVKNNYDALTFSPGNHLQLAKLIEQLLLNQTMAANLAKNGFETVKNFDIKNLGSSLHNFILRITNDKNTTN